jgi:protein-S-isoprenylcysteine O-methyltransferase Ste14
MGRILGLVYAGVAYVLSLASFLYAVGWLGDVPGLPTTIDGRPGMPWLQALPIDVGLLSLFAVQHSAMARPGFKRLWTRMVPPAIERSTYVLATSACLFALCLFWQSLPGTVWRLQGPAAALAWGLFALGWLVVLASTFMVSHVDLFGLRQAFQGFLGQAPAPLPFTSRYLYGIVRHPIMLGFLVAFWSAPVMTTARLVFASITTAYVLVALRLEERDLRRALGEEYAEYQERVPMLVPRLPSRHPERSFSRSP